MRNDGFELKRETEMDITAHNSQISGIKYNEILGKTKTFVTCYHCMPRIAFMCLEIRNSQKIPGHPHE